MKQNHLLQWIEAAEARSVCVLAEEDPTRATIMPIMANMRPFDLGNLRKQLCLGDAGKRLSRLSAIPFANCRVRMRLR